MTNSQSYGPKSHADDGDSKGAPDPLTTFSEHRSLLASALDWTIARPPRLTNGPLTRRYDVDNGHLPGRGGAFASISRADVADFVLGELQRNAHVHQIGGIARGKRGQE